MSNIKLSIYSAILFITFLGNGCGVKSLVKKTENRSVPETYTNQVKDSLNTASIDWHNFFHDAQLEALIDTALKNNQELNIMMQEIRIAQNEVRARKGAYLPSIGLGGRAGIDRVGRYTSQGASDRVHDITPGKTVPENLPTFMFGATMSWEIDIWKKLRNAKKSAVYNFLATDEGKNFMVTQLIAEIASSYYELLALDNQLEIITKNIEVQLSALDIVKMEKSSAKVTELAVRRFEAEVLKNQSRQYDIMQQITETQNKINFLIGRFPQPVVRNASGFLDRIADTIHTGIPSQLLENRPDIRQAEQQLAASKLDVKAAKANFYPSIMITGGAGYAAFNPKYLVTTPESLIFALAGDLVAPLINRNAIKAAYYSANAKQVQAAYNYERVVLRAYMEVANEQSNIFNLQKSYELKSKQVQTLTRSIDISTGLFKSARADYMEVLLTQRDALESKFDLIETKKQQMQARVNLYQALGGGWE